MKYWCVVFSVLETLFFVGGEEENNEHQPKSNSFVQLQFVIHKELADLLSLTLITNGPTAVCP